MMEYELYHHGVKGMKWGVRRYQNADGSYTNAGRTRYSRKEAKQEARRQKYLAKTQRGISRNEKRIGSEKRLLNDLKKQGTNHQLVNERAKYNAREKSEDFFDTAEEFLGEGSFSSRTRNIGAASTYFTSSEQLKKEAYSELVSESNNRIKSYTKKSERWMAANEAVMNMPANSSNKQYRKAIRAAKKAIG